MSEARPAWRLLLLVLLLHAAFLVLPRDLWVQDEARYGEVVREMLQGGSLLVPHLDGHPYPDKPPTYFWLVILLGQLVGHGEFAFRLLSSLATMAATLGVWRWAARVGGEAVGIRAAVLFATAFLTLVVGQIVRMDMLLTAATAWAWWGLWRHAAGEGGRLAFWLGTLAGVAVKGPIALLFTLLPAVLWRLRAGGLRGLLALRPVSGTLALAAMVGLWVGAVIASGEGEYLRRIWHEQLVGRAVDSWSHREPFWFYAALLPLLALPWTGAAIRGARALARRPAGERWGLGLAVVAPLAGLSVISGKLFIYLEPLFPALMTLAALAPVGPGRPRPVESLPPALLYGGLGAALFWAIPRYLGGDAAWATAGAGVLLGVGIVGLWAARQPEGRWRRIWIGLAVAASWALFGLVARDLERAYSPRPLGETVAGLAGDGRPVGIVRSTRGIFNYYAGRTFTELQRAEAGPWFRRRPGAVLIVQERDLGFVFPEPSRAGACTVDRIFEVEFKRYHVLAGC